MTTRFTLLFTLVLPFNSIAATYYVDSSFGNDKWTGQQAAPNGSPATDGPWQSLAKVSSRVLIPGDSVLLKCGGIWNETLTLKNSGTATSPITIGAYPNGCTNKPVITGAAPIPGHNWVRDTGNIYKLSSAIDLISFGTFENGLGNWAKWSPKNNATMTVNTNCATPSTCMSFMGGTETSIAISNNFILQGKQSYITTFTLKSPVGVPVMAVLRRGAPPWDTVGLTTSIVGTGNWQTLEIPFIATASLTNARLDFVVPANTNIGLDNVKITSALSDVAGIFDSGKSLNVAHHPNRGHDSLKPNSLYYTAAENANVVSSGSGTGSSYLPTGSDLSASALSAITPGTGIRIRTTAWDISDRKIVSVSGSHLSLDSPTRYPIEKNWGYFLYGQRWMLDEPGEWHYDAVTKTLSIWMPDNTTPGNRISAGQRLLGIDASNVSYVRINGLTIQNVGTGVNMYKATNVVLSNMNIFDTLGFGVDALQSTDSGVENSQIVRTTSDAISTVNSGGSSTRFHAYDNLIMDSSIQSTNGVITSLPWPAKAALMVGHGADIRRNRIYGAGYIGIWALSNSFISGNHVENTCLVLDDCGAIYTNGQNNNSIIENNTVLHVAGGLLGKPANLSTQAQGIYIDDLGSGVTVRGNTAVNADSGIQLHNAANNRVENNTLYGNRRHQIWLQEGTNRLSTEGDVYNNLVLGNRLFSTLATTAVGQVTELSKTNTHRFASFDSNLYFTLLSPTISSETWPSGGSSYILPAWQAAVTSTGVPRNLDPTASEVDSASIGYAAFHTTGANILPNGNLALGKTGWTAWNMTAPYGVMALESCTPASQCLLYTSGASESLLSSPNFSVQKDQWYKVSFDLKTGTDGQSVSLLARRGGGGTNGYEYLMGTPVNFRASTTWQRYGFTFKAIKTVNANDPVTLDLGARIDFTRVFPGQNLSVANLEVVPLSSTESTSRSHILINPTGTPLEMDCPDGSNTIACSEYVRFTDSQVVAWPYTLPPHGSEIIYSRDSKLTDGDGDGIPDYQDLCNGTVASKAVNASGCTLGQ